MQGPSWATSPRPNPSRDEEGVPRIHWKIDLDLPAIGPEFLEFNKIDPLGSTLRSTPGSQCHGDVFIRTYTQPIRKNFAAVDSMSFSKNSTTGTYNLYLFQTTVSTHHPIKVSPTGLKYLYAGLLSMLKKARIYTPLISNRSFERSSWKPCDPSSRS